MSEEQLDGLKRVITFLVLVVCTFAVGIFVFAMMLASQSYWTRLFDRGYAARCAEGL